jgi:hypothetical protein
MGSAFVVLGAVYRLAVGELAAIAEAALYMVLPATGVATPLHYPGRIAALQPEVGRRGRWRGAGHSRQRERGSHSMQSHFSLPKPNALFFESIPEIGECFTEKLAGQRH